MLRSSTIGVFLLFAACGLLASVGEGKSSSETCVPGKDSRLPDTLSHVDLEADFLTRINALFPEYSHPDPALIDPTINPNVHFLEEGNITFTFVHEGAGYRNQFGYFTYNDTHIVEEKIVFPDASYPSQGCLSSGDYVSFGPFPAGTTMGFWIISDGYKNPKGRKYRSINNDLWKNPDGLRHIAVYKDRKTNRVVIGFEDLYKLGDKDYNDVVFFANVTVVIDTSSIPEVDEDGNLIVREPPVNRIFHDGIRYALLADLYPERLDKLCMRTGNILPEGWELAANNGHSKGVIMSHTWGTDCVVLGDGTAYETLTGAACGSGFLKSGPHPESPTQTIYWVDDCSPKSKQILIYHVGNTTDPDETISALVGDTTDSLIFEGKQYGVLDGASPSDSAFSYNPIVKKIPSGWSIAADEEQTRAHIMGVGYRYGAACVVVSNGKSINTLTGEYCDADNDHLLAVDGTKYKGDGGNSKVLVSKTTALSNTWTTVVTSVTNKVVLGGYLYATVDNIDGNLNEIGCQEVSMKIPSGWVLVNETDKNLDDLLALSSFGTGCMVLSNGKSTCDLEVGRIEGSVAGLSSVGSSSSQASGYALSADSSSLLNVGEYYAVSSCPKRILVKKAGTSSRYIGDVYGLTHFRSFDGLTYSFVTAGEFKLVEAVGDDFEVQVRLSQFGSFKVSYVSAVVLKKGSKTLMLEASGNGEPKVYIDGVLGAWPASAVYAGVGTATTQNGVYDLNTDPDENDNVDAKTYKFVSVDGETVTIRHLNTSVSGVFHVRVSIPTSVTYSTKGLLGPANRNGEDDLTKSDGTVTTLINGSLPLQSDVQAFGLTWAVTSGNSLFTYEGGKTTADFTDASFGGASVVGAPCGTYDSSVNAREACKLYGLTLNRFKHCVWDVCATNMTNLAEFAHLSNFLLVDESSITYNTTQRDHVYTKTFAGRMYTLIDDADPDSERVGCQVDAHLVPSGYHVAENRAINRAAITNYKWGTSCVGMKDGVSITPELVECGRTNVQRLGERGEFVRPFSCSERVLAVKDVPSLSNLVPNGGFESSSNWLPQGIGFEYSMTSPRNGAKALCMKVEDVTTEYAGAYQDVVLNQTATQAFSVGVWSSAFNVSPTAEKLHNFWVPTYSLVVQGYDKDGKSVFSGHREFELNTHSYYFETLDVIASVPIYRLRVILQFTDLTGHVCFDDLITGPPSGNLLLNPGMDLIIWGEYFLLDVIKTLDDGTKVRIKEILFDPYPFAKYWEGYGKGAYEVSSEHVFPSNVGEGRSYSGMVKIEESTEKEYGILQRVNLDGMSGDNLAFYVSGYSKAEGVSGEMNADYSIYIDIEYVNGTGLYGNFLPFNTGTHDWEYRDLLVPVTEPVKQITFVCLFRKKTGKVWFDDVSLIAINRGSGSLSQLRGSFGDPHISTYDGLVYDFQQIGEFVLHRDSNLEVQVRTTQLGDGSVTKAAAMILKGDGAHITATVTKGDESPVVLLNGTRLDFSSSAVLSMPASDGEIGVSGVLGNPNDPLRYTIRSGASGHVVQFVVLRSTEGEKEQFMQVLVSPPSGVKGSISGLLGDWDGDVKDDTALILDENDQKNPPTLPSYIPSEYTHVFSAKSTFVESIRVSAERSLFVYGVGESSFGFTDSSFTAPELASFSEEKMNVAASACRAESLTGSVFSACFRDVLFTQDVSVAKGYLGLQSQMGFTTSSLLDFSSASSDSDDGDDNPDTMLIIWFIAIGVFVVCVSAAVVGIVFYRRKKRTRLRNRVVAYEKDVMEMSDVETLQPGHSDAMRARSAPVPKRKIIPVDE